MQERELRDMIGRVKAGSLSRREFVQGMMALGLTAPLAAQMLASAGVAQAQPKGAMFTPTKRGGGGQLKVLWWQAPTLLNPHFATGTKDQDGSRIFYEPLAAYDPEGNLFPVLAAEIPTVQNGGRRPGRPLGHLEAQEGRHLARRQALHRRRRGVQLGVRPRSQDRGADHRLLHRHREDRRAGHPHRPARLQEAGAVLGRRLLRRGRHDHPEASLRGLQGREVARGARTTSSRSAPAPTSSWTSSRATSCAARSTRATTSPNRPFFDSIEMKGGGDAVSAARAVMQTGEYDYAWNMQVEDEILKRFEQGGRGKADMVDRRQHGAHPAQQHRPVDRGGRRALQPQDQAPLPDRPRGAPGAEPAGGPGLRSRSRSTGAPRSPPRTS